MAQYTFICYTHENSRFAKKLARHLHRHGIVVWLDQWNLTPEQEWDKAIDRAIRHCRYFLIILSPAAVKSWVVRNQFGMAELAGKTMVPVLHQLCELPVELQQFQSVDFTYRNFRRGLRQLVAQLSGQEAGFKSETNIDWVELLQAWLHKLLPLLWPGWLGPLLLLMLLVSGSSLFWPDVGSATFSATPAAERLVVVVPTPSPEPIPLLVSTRVRAKDGKVMVFVPAGEFLMGSAETDLAASEDEKPRHPVYLDAYWIDKTEVTNIQYQLCVEDGACTPYHSQGRRFEDDYQPVVGVNWFQAKNYCEWAGGRLPTEAEWEKAARGTDGRIFPWGNEFDGTRLNYCDRNCNADWRDMSADDRYTYTAPVGIYLNGASPYGALDMSGNVWEWTADWYAVDYYSRSTYENPTGPSSGQQRIVRGGSWYYYGKNLRTAKRHRDLPTYSYDNIGFRCVVSDREQ